MFALDTQYQAESFDMILDKGALDAFLTADEENDPWNSSPEASRLTNKMMRDVSRLLTKGGSYVHMSFREPHFRNKHFVKEEYNWDALPSRTYGSGYFPYRFYQMKKL